MKKATFTSRFVLSVLLSTSMAGAPALALADEAAKDASATTTENAAVHEKPATLDAAPAVETPQATGTAQTLEAPASPATQDVPASPEVVTTADSPASPATPETPLTDPIKPQDYARATEGWHDVDDNGTKYRVYLKDGAPLKGKHQIDQYTYLFKEPTGARYSGWNNDNADGSDHWEYYDLSGARVSRWNKIDGSWYYFDETTGYAKTGWFELGNKYYFDPATCKMAVGWKFIDGQWYFFDADGDIGHDWRLSDGQWYYINQDGTMRKGWLCENGLWYFLDETSGFMHKFWMRWNGGWFYFGDNGVMRTGWVDADGKRYFMAYDGYMHTGWYDENGAIYYLNPEAGGAMAKGRLVVNGYVHFFDGEGREYWPNEIVADALNRAQNYSSPTDYMIFVNDAECRVIILHRDGDGWVSVADWWCTPGAWGTPTVKGVFSINDNRGYVFGSGYSCYYYSSFYGAYLFHSVLYNEGTFTVQDGRLGEHLSHGCVRLALENAKWLYYNVPVGTTVVVF